MVIHGMALLHGFCCMLMFANPAMCDHAALSSHTLSLYQLYCSCVNMQRRMMVSSCKHYECCAAIAEVYPLQV